MMLTTQPFFLPGIEDPHEAKSSAFGAFGIFIFTFLLSGYGIYYDNQKKAEVGGIEPEAEYHLATGDVPNYGT
jgi:hypothetical protein